MALFHPPPPLVLLSSYLSLLIGATKAIFRLEYLIIKLRACSFRNRHISYFKLHHHCQFLGDHWQSVRILSCHWSLI